MEPFLLAVGRIQRSEGDQPTVFVTGIMPLTDIDREHAGRSHDFHGASFELQTSVMEERPAASARPIWTDRSNLVPSHKEGISTTVPNWGLL